MSSHPTEPPDDRTGRPPPPANPYAQPGDPYGQPATPHGQPGTPYGQQPPTGPEYPPQPGYDPRQQYAGPQQGFRPQPYPGQPPVTRQPPLSPSDEKLWATLSHISIPFIGLVGPLVVFLVFKDRGPFVRAHAIESLNFSILYTVAQFVSGMLTVALIGYVLLPVVLVGALVLCILAGIAANKGEYYRYAVNWRLVK
jgi:uncharacterized Tic20 family protein